MAAGPEQATETQKKDPSVQQSVKLDPITPKGESVKQLANLEKSSGLSPSVSKETAKKKETPSTIDFSENSQGQKSTIYFDKTPKPVQQQTDDDTHDETADISADGSAGKEGLTFDPEKLKGELGWKLIGKMLGELLIVTTVAVLGKKYLIKPLAVIAGGAVGMVAGTVGGIGGTLSAVLNLGKNLLTSGELLYGASMLMKNTKTGGGSPISFLEARRQYKEQNQLTWRPVFGVISNSTKNGISKGFKAFKTVKRVSEWVSDKYFENALEAQARERIDYQLAQARRQEFQKKTQAAKSASDATSAAAQSAANSAAAQSAAIPSASDAPSAAAQSAAIPSASDAPSDGSQKVSQETINDLATAGRKLSSLQGNGQTGEELNGRALSKSVPVPILNSFSRTRAKTLELTAKPAKTQEKAISRGRSHSVPLPKPS